MAAVAAGIAAVGWELRRPNPGYARPLVIPWPLLAGLLLAALLFSVTIETRRETTVISLADIPMAAGLVFCRAPQFVLASLAAAVLCYGVVRRQPVYKLAFNISMVALQAVVAAETFDLVLGTSSPVSRLGWGAVTLALFASLMVSVTVTIAVITAAAGPREGFRVVEGLPVMALVTFIDACVGLIAVVVLWQDWLGGILLVGVCVALGLGYQAHQQLRRRQSVLERVYDFAQAIDGQHDLASLLAVTLASARETMGARGSELWIRQSASWMHYRSDDEGLSILTAVRPEKLEQMALVGTKGLLVPRGRKGDPMGLFGLDERGVEDAIAVPLQGADLEAVLTVTDRVNQIDTFTADDLRALTNMASHATMAITSVMLLDRLQLEVAEKRHQALHDALTGLPNRTLFGTRVEDLLARQAEGEGPATAAVILFDLDGFREVNDTLGHGVGDVVLRTTAARLRREVGRRGTVARLGGDEFAVVLPVTDDEDAMRVGQEVKQSIEQPIEEDELLIEVRASVGIVLCPTHGDDSATLLRLADVAMYLAKDHRTGVVMYEPRHDHYTPRRLALAGELRQALAGRDLSLAYQPQLDLATGAITAVEALVRWSHRKHGLVPPDEFIPVAEQTGLIVALTDYVLGEALAQQALWRQRGLDLMTAVNLSPRVVQDGQLPALVSRRLVEAGVPADRLTLELTETGLVTDPARVAAVLNQLAGMGVRISIDDFGTGYSSLSRLSNLPVSEVKIDKSFVFAMADRGAETLVRSIVDLGHNLNLRVVAEGVEDLPTLDRLRALGCNAVQGHVLSRAVTGPALETWLQNRSVGTDTSRVIVPLRKPRAEPGV